MKPPAIITCIVTFFLLAAGNNAHANQTDDPDEKQSAVKIKGTASQARTWEQLTPSASRFDWIQLTSDEWLKGDLESLYDGKVEFVSVEQVNCSPGDRLLTLYALFYFRTGVALSNGFSR